MNDFRLRGLDRLIAKDEPQTNSFVRRKRPGKRWRRRSIRDIIRSKFCCISPRAFRRRMCASPTYNQSARQISVDGEAKSAAPAYQFVEKVKNNPVCRRSTFDMARRRAFCRTSTPNFVWRENRDEFDSAMVRANESARAKLLSLIVAAVLFYCSIFLSGAGFSAPSAQARSGRVTCITRDTKGTGGISQGARALGHARPVAAETSAAFEKFRRSANRVPRQA